VTLPRTPSQTVGPFYAIGLTRAPRAPQNELADRDDPAATQLIGQLIDGQGAPIGDGMVEIWDDVGKRWGRSGTDSEGRFSFLVTKPDSHAGEAPRFDVFVFARGMLRHELTRIYFPDEEGANAVDRVWSALDKAARSTLVAEAEDGALRFDIRMQGDGHTLFFEH
jgi:protocatechuate 3,4-dioxygenase, alpha subunit